MWYLPGSRIEPVSPALAGDCLPLSCQGSPDSCFYSRTSGKQNWPGHCLCGTTVLGKPVPLLQVCPKFSSVQSLSRVRLFATPWTAAHQASLSIANSWSLLKLMSIESVMPSNHLILCRPLLLPSSIFPSIRVFSTESVLRIRQLKNVQTTKKVCSSTC